MWKAKPSAIYCIASLLFLTWDKWRNQSKILRGKNYWL